MDKHQNELAEYKLHIIYDFTDFEDLVIDINMTYFIQITILCYISFKHTFLAVSFHPKAE